MNDSATFSNGAAGFRQAVVKILADSGITGDYANKVSSIFHLIEVVAIDADLRKIVGFSFGCIRKAVYDVL